VKKLKLQLNDLRIETFDTTSATGQKGTVLGEQCTCQTQCSCPGATCDWSCENSCPDASCFESCAWTCGAACGSRHTCDYFTCNGYVTDWYGQCVIC
jgi:hypothetical protein